MLWLNFSYVDLKFKFTLMCPSICLFVLSCFSDPIHYVDSLYLEHAQYVLHLSLPTKILLPAESLCCVLEQDTMLIVVSGACAICLCILVMPAFVPGPEVLKLFTEHKISTAPKN